MVASGAAMKTFAPLLATLTLTLGCNTPPKDPARDAPDPPTAADASKPSTPTATATATATPTPTPTATPTAPSPTAPVTAKPATCTGDADCRTFASYCAEAPCACRVLGKGAGDPKCAGSGANVSCFADPCLKKSAQCQGGACVLTAKGAAATER